MGKLVKQEVIVQETYLCDCETSSLTLAWTGTER